MFSSLKSNIPSSHVIGFNFDDKVYSEFHKIGQYFGRKGVRKFLSAKFCRL